MKVTVGFKMRERMRERGRERERYDDDDDDDDDDTGHDFITDISVVWSTLG